MSKEMKVEVKKTELVITIPIDKHLSKSGKTTVIATSHGNQPTNATVDGKVLTVGVNAYIKK